MRRDAKALTWFWFVLLTVVVGACKKKQAAGGAADAAADGDQPTGARRAPPEPPRAGDRAGARAADAGRGHDRLEVARRSEPRLAARAAVLRARQLRCQRRRPAGAAGQRGGAEEIPDVADHDRGPLRRARHRRIQPRAWRAARAGGEELPGLARHSGRQGARPSATARSSRSMPGTTTARGRRTAARIS